MTPPDPLSTYHHRTTTCTMICEAIWTFEVSLRSLARGHRKRPSTPNRSPASSKSTPRPRSTSRGFDWLAGNHPAKAERSGPLGEMFIWSMSGWTVIKRNPGGAIAIRDAQLTLNRVTVSASQSVIDGGAIWIDNAVADLAHLTLSGNQAGGTGGGLFAGSNSVVNLSHSTIHNNLAAAGGGVSSVGDVHLADTVVAGNSAVLAVTADLNGHIISRGHNLIGILPQRPTTLYAVEAAMGQPPSLMVTDPAGLPSESFEVLVGDATLTVGNVIGHRLMLDEIGTFDLQRLSLTDGLPVRYDSFWKSDQWGTVDHPLNPALGSLAAGPTSDGNAAVPGHSPLDSSPLIDGGSGPEGLVWLSDIWGEDRYVDGDDDHRLESDIGAVELARWVSVTDRHNIQVETDSEDGQSYRFELTRNDASTSLVVDYRVAGDGPHAANPNDFVGRLFPNGSVAFAAGQYVQEIVFDVIGDDIVEHNQDFVLDLTGVSQPITIHNARATGTIVNDDVASFQVTGTRVKKDEGLRLSPPQALTPIAFEISLNGRVEGGVTAQYLVTTLFGSVTGPLEGELFFDGRDGQTQTVMIYTTANGILEINQPIRLSVAAVDRPDDVHTAIVNAADTAYVISNGTYDFDLESLLDPPPTPNPPTTTDEDQSGDTGNNDGHDDGGDGDGGDGDGGYGDGGYGDGGYGDGGYGDGGYGDGGYGDGGYGDGGYGDGGYGDGGYGGGGDGDGGYGDGGYGDGGYGDGGYGDGGYGDGGSGGGGHGGDGNAPSGGGGSSVDSLDFCDVSYLDGFHFEQARTPLIDVRDPPAWASLLNNWTSLELLPYNLFVVSDGYFDDDGVQLCDAQSMSQVVRAAPPNPDDLYPPGSPQHEIWQIRTRATTHMRTELDQRILDFHPTFLGVIDAVDSYQWTDYQQDVVDYMDRLLGLRFELRYDHIPTHPYLPSGDHDAGNDGHSGNGDELPGQPGGNSTSDDPLNPAELPQWVKHEDQTFTTDQLPWTHTLGIPNADLVVSHNSELTFSPFASLPSLDGLDINENTVLTLAIDAGGHWSTSHTESADRYRDANDDGVVDTTNTASNPDRYSVDLETIIVNEDRTITYTPHSQGIGSTLQPRVNADGNVYRYDGPRSITTTWMIQSGPGANPVPLGDPVTISLIVKDDLPVLRGDRIHQPDAASGTLLPDSSIHVGFDTTLRVDLVELLRDPDGDPIRLLGIVDSANPANRQNDGTIPLAIGQVQRATVHRPLSGVLPLLGSISPFANTNPAVATWQSGEVKSLTARTVSPTLVDLHNPVTLADVTGSLTGRTRWSPDAAAQNLSLDLLLHSGRTDAEGKVIVRPVRLDVDVDADSRPESLASTQTIQPWVDAVSPSLPQRGGEQGDTTLWSVRTGDLSTQRHFENVAGTDVDLLGGTFTIDHALLLDRSGGGSELAVPGLRYDSATAIGQRPVVQAQLTPPSDFSGGPVDVTLIWIDHHDTSEAASPLGREHRTSQTIPLSGSGPVTVALAAGTAPAATGLYSWRLEMRMPGDILITHHGQTPVVVKASPDQSASPGQPAIFGNGWSLAGVPTLTLDRLGDFGDHSRGWNPDGFDDRVILSFPGQSPQLFDYSDLTVADKAMPMLLPSILPGSRTHGGDGARDPHQYGTLTARLNDDHPHPEATDSHTPDELVYKSADGTEYVFYRYQLPSDPGETQTTYLINRIEQPGIDFDPSELLPAGSTQRRGVSFERDADPVSSTYGRLLAIIAADGARTELSYDAAGHVDLLTGPSGNVTDLTIDTEGDLTVVDHQNVVLSTASSASAVQRVRQFTYSDHQMGGHQWLPGSTDPSAPSLDQSTVLTTFDYDRPGITERLGLARITIGESASVLGDSLIYHVVPAALGGLVQLPAQTAGIPIQALTAEVVHVAGFDKYTGESSAPATLSGDYGRSIVFDVRGHAVESQTSFAGQTLATESWRRDAIGNVVLHTDSQGLETHFQYDYQTPAVEGGDSPGVYDADDYRGNVTQITTPTQTQTFRYETDDAQLDAVGGLLIATTLVKGGTNLVTKTTRDTDGRVTEVRRVRGGGDAQTNVPGLDWVQTWLYHGGGGRLQSTTDPRGLVTTYDEYEHGRVTQTTTVDAEYGGTYETRYGHDAAGWVNEIQSRTDGHLVSTERFVHDATGLTLSTSTLNSDDEVLAHQRFLHNADGAVIRSTVPAIVGGADTPRDVHTDFFYTPAGLIRRQVTAGGELYRSHYTGVDEDVAATIGYRYYADGTLRQVGPQDAAGNLTLGTTTHFYDPVNHLHWTQTDGLAGVGGAFDQTQTVLSTHNAAGSLLTTEDLTRSVTHHSGVDPDNALHREVAPKTRYNSGGTAVEIGSRTIHDGLGRVVANLSTGGGSSRTQYDTLGMATGSHDLDYAGAFREFSTNAAGDVLTITEHRVTPTETGVTVVPVFTQMDYDQFGRLRQAFDPVIGAGPSPHVATVQYTYDPAQKAIRVSTTSRLGVASDQWFDAAGRLIREQNASGAVTTYQYDPAGQLLSQTVTPAEADAATTTQTFHHDQRGRLRNTISETTGPGGTVETFAAVDHFDFGDETADGWNAIAYGTLPGDGSSGIPAADKHNADRSRTDAAGTVVLHQAPDPAGTGSADVPTTLIDRVTSGGQSVVTTTLIAAANVTGTAMPTSTDPDQTRKSRQTFDAAGNLLIGEVFDTYAIPSSPTPMTGYRLVVSNQYHPATGRLAHSTNGLGQTTDYDYDPLTGLLASVTKPNGEVTGYEYDSAGNRTRLTYTGAPAGGGDDTAWTYDAMGRAIEETVAGIAGSRTWIHAGLVTTYNDRNGVDHVTTLDPVAGTLQTAAVDGNLTYNRTETYASTGGMRQVTESLTEAGVSVYDSAFSYDADLSDSVSTDTRQIGFGTKRLDHVVRLDLDDRRRVDARTTAWGTDPNAATDLWSDDFDVDTLGRQTGVQRTIDDLATDIDSIWNDADEPDDIRLSYGYNADGSRDSLQRFNVADNASPAAWSDYEYTPGGRVASIRHANDAGGSYLAEHQYAYDAAGRLASQSDHRTDGAGGFNHVSNRQFTHDAAGQLTQALETINAGTTVVRDYTDGQSSTDAVFLVGDDNRLTRDDRYDYLYTPEGQLSIRTSRLSPLAGASDEFRYGPAGRLIEVTMKDPGGAVTGIVQYGYDANGLMSGRRELAADGTTVLSHTGYLHQGLQRIAELDLSSNEPSISHLYLHGTQANEVVATSTFVNAGYDTVWSFTDALGSVTTTATKSLSDWSVVHTVTAEYGSSPSWIGDTNLEALMSLQVWAGHHRDEATGLIEAKARWFDPDSGRFTVPDPKGFAAGDANLYRYVGNGPGNAVDPDGLEERKTGVLHAVDLALGRSIQWLFRRADDVYYGRGGGKRFIQDQVQHLGETPQRFQENGERIGRFPGQFRHRKLTAQKADLDLEIIDRQIEAGTFRGDRTEQRLEIFRHASSEIDQSYQVQLDSLKASGELAVETILIGAPLAPKLNLRVGVTGLARGRVVAPNRGLPRTSAPTEFIQTDVARSLGAARHPMMQRLDDVLTRHGGTQTADGYFHFGSRRSARAAASELAGDLGYAPVAIRKSDFRGGPWSWRNSNGVIGRQQLDPLDPTKSLSGWRDDILGHTFGDGATIGPHVNVWNEFFENLHLTY